MEYSFFYLLFLETTEGCLHITIRCNVSWLLTFAKNGQHDDDENKRQVCTTIATYNKQRELCFPKFFIVSVSTIQLYLYIYMSILHIFTCFMGLLFFSTFFFFEKHTHTGRKFIFIGSKCESDGIM